MADNIRFFRGDEGIATGEVRVLDGIEFEAVRMIEGRFAGQIKWVATAAQRQKNAEQSQREWADQQAEFRRLRESKAR